MKIRLGILISLLVVPIAAYGHSEFFFPKIFSRAELSNTGFALLNLEPFPATVTFYLVSAGGTLVASASVPVASGGQAAKLGSELFPAATAGGWIYAINDTEGMQAFWLNYDSEMTFLDGAEAIQIDMIGPDQVIPLVAGQAELNVINPNGITVPINITLFGDDGAIAPVLSRVLPIAGGFQAQVSTLFPSAEMSRARYIRIQSSGAPTTSSLVIRDFLVPNESAIVNGVNVAPLTELNFPHVVNGVLAAANYTTVIGVANLSASSQTVTLTFFPDDRAPVAIARTLSRGGALRETAQDLFGFPPEFQSGWVQVSGTAAITGFAAYADSAGGGLAVVPAGTAQTNLFFSHIANGPPQWQTGVALLNSSGDSADVEVYAVNSSGSLIGGALNVPTARFTLGPGKKIASVLHEWVPATQGVNGGFVYVRTTNGVPLHGIELFYTQDLKVLSNVPAGKLVSGVTYAPPSP